MSITTYTLFMTDLAALTITGVTRAYTEPPRQINTADLPCSYPSLPTGGENPVTGDVAGGWPTLRADLVIALEPWAQNTKAANFAATNTMMDRTSETLRYADLARSRIRWTIRADVVTIGDTPYWAVVATVEGQG